MTWWETSMNVRMLAAKPTAVTGSIGLCMWTLLLVVGDKAVRKRPASLNLELKNFRFLKKSPRRKLNL
jgi:hypothetical protein